MPHIAVDLKGVSFLDMCKFLNTYSALYPRDSVPEIQEGMSQVLFSLSLLENSSFEAKSLI
jgi:hypothetical protein